MICRAFKDLTGPTAKEISCLMGVYGESPTGGHLVDIQIGEGEIRISAHAREAFATLALRIDHENKQKGIRLEVTDRQTGLQVVSERDAHGRLTVYQLDNDSDTIKEISLPRPQARSQQLKELSEAVMVQILKTNDSKFG